VFLSFNSSTSAAFIAELSASKSDSKAFPAAALAFTKFQVHIDIGPFTFFITSEEFCLSDAESALGTINVARLPMNVFPKKDLLFMIIFIENMKFKEIMRFFSSIVVDFL
jgi:hypothetical protein